MRFDTKRRVYVDDNGQVMSAAEVRAEVQVYVDQQKEKTERDAEKLLAGSLTLAAFFALMRTRIRDWHEVTGSIAYGGKAQLDSARRERIAAKVASELDFLKKFQEQAREMLMKAKDAVTPEKPLQEAFAEAGASIPSRAGMYADSAYATYENNVVEREMDNGVTLGRRICVDDPASCEECPAAATEEFIPLDQIPEIGSLTCLNNCRCFLELETVQTPPATLVDRSQQADAVQ